MRHCKIALVAASLGLLCFLAPQIRAANPEATEAKIPLSVGYFGDPQSARGKDFLQFLQKHFATATAGKLTEFEPKKSELFDVVILDYDELKIVNKRIQMPSVPCDKSFRRPTMTLGATGALICDRMGLKTGYL